ncbi:MAG: prevent-host-death protein [Opitutaceae bacterium]
MRNTYSVATAQANLPSILRKADDEIAVVERRGEVCGFIVGKKRMEAITETIELLGNPEFTATMAKHRRGKLKFLPLSALDA